MDDNRIIRNWNYNLSLFSKTEWIRYYYEYSLAIENILERSDQSQTSVLTLPTLFLIRHSLELAFKMNLIELEKISGEKASIDYKGKTAHILSKLHSEFERQVHLIIKKENISGLILEDFCERNSELKSFRILFDKLDNWSYSFRYPVQNDGSTRSFKEEDTINIAEIIPAYKKTKTILTYTINVLLDSTSKNDLTIK